MFNGRFWGNGPTTIPAVKDVWDWEKDTTAPEIKPAGSSVVGHFHHGCDWLEVYEAQERRRKEEATKYPKHLYPTLFFTSGVKL